MAVTSYGINVIASSLESTRGINWGKDAVLSSSIVCSVKKMLNKLTFSLSSEKIFPSTLSGGSNDVFDGLINPFSVLLLSLFCWLTMMITEDSYLAKKFPFEGNEM